MVSKKSQKNCKRLIRTKELGCMRSRNHSSRVEKREGKRVEKREGKRVEKREGILL